MFCMKCKTELEYEEDSDEWIMDTGLTAIHHTEWSCPDCGRVLSLDERYKYISSVTTIEDHAE